MAFDEFIGSVIDANRCDERFKIRLLVSRHDAGMMKNCNLIFKLLMEHKRVLLKRGKHNFTLKIFSRILTVLKI